MKHLLLAVTLSLSGLALAEEGTSSGVGSSVPGPHVGSFGLNASFLGSAVASLNAGLFQAPTVGARYFFKDTLALNLDLGFSVQTAPSSAPAGTPAAYGFNVAGTVDIFLAKFGALRPFAVAGAAFGKTFSAGNRLFGVEADGGVGAEYWFSDHFSLAGRLMLGVPFVFDPLVVRIVTFTPGLRATFYF